MKIYKIFIAAGEELQAESLEFGDMVQQLNNVFKLRNFEIELEYLPTTSEEYLQELNHCELCLVLYWNKFEDYTESKFNTAYEELKAGRNPKKMYVYFKEPREISDDLKNFKESFTTRYGHFYCRFENVDTMRLHFLLQFEDYYNQSERNRLLEVHDSKVNIDGVTIAELKNVSFAANNLDYLDILYDIEKVQTKVLKYPDDEDFRKELEDKKKKLNEIEQNLINTAKTITKLSTIKSSIRLDKAAQLFEAGDYHGANAILNLEAIDNEALANVNRIDSLREIEVEAVKALEISIEQYYLKINLLRNEKTPDWVQEVIEIYQKIVNIARNRISEEKFVVWIYYYANFVYNENSKKEALNLYMECLKIYEKLAIIDSDYESDVLWIRFSIVQTQMEISGTIDEVKEQEYKDIWEEYYKLVKRNPQSIDILKKWEAVSLDFYEIHLKDTEAIHKVRIVKEQIVKTLHELSQTNPIYCLKLAENEYEEIKYCCYRGFKFKKLELDILFLLIDLYFELHYYDKVREKANLLFIYANQHKRYSQSTEIIYNKVVDIYRKLASKDFNKFGHLLISPLNELALVYHGLQRYDLVEKTFIEIVEVCQRISKPFAERDMATALYNLAVLCEKKQQYDLAEERYTESLEIFRRRSEMILNDKYDPYASVKADELKCDIAMTLNSLAILHKNIKQYGLAEEEHNEALEIYRKQSKQYHAVKARVAKTLNFLAALHSDLHQYDLAENEYNEALDIFRILFEIRPDVFEKKVAGTLYDLADLHRNYQRYDLAEKEYNEALKIYRQQSHKKPDDFEMEASILEKLVNLHKMLKWYDLAEKEFNELQEIRQRLSLKDLDTNI